MSNLQTTVIPEKQLADETTIFKYMDFVSFYALLINKTLFFKRLDKFSDLNEGTLSDEVIEQIRLNRSNFEYTLSEEAERYAVKYAEKVISEKPFTLCNSWTIDDVDNYAMWKIYLKGYSEGVAIKTTVGRLKSALNYQSNKSLHFGKVNYQPSKLKPINIFEVATTKATAYAYEKEFRAFLVQQFRVITLKTSDKSTAFKDPKYNVGCELSVDLQELIDVIYISPFATQWFKDLFNKTISTYMTEFPITNVKNSSIKDS